jgi:hypothetical protein
MKKLECGAFMHRMCAFHKGNALRWKKYQKKE